MRETLEIQGYLARLAFLASLAFLAALLSACGYQFRVEGAGPTIGGGPSAPPGTVPTLKIVNFENKSFEPNLEMKYTTYARREFAAGSGTRVVNDGEPADLILKCQINSVSYPTINFSLQGTFESRATANVSAIVEDAKTNKRIWTQVVSASAEFFMTDDLQFNRLLQNRALEQAGRLIAEDLATRFQDFLDRKAREASKPAAGSADGAAKPDKERGSGSPAK